MVGRRTRRKPVRGARIHRVAELIVGKHGKEALAVATERAYDRLGLQDYRAAVLWTRVAEEVHRILPEAKPEHAHGRVGASLEELMDDPVMTAMVGHGDDHRRHAVHKTISHVKRRLRRAPKR